MKSLRKSFGANKEVPISSPLPPLSRPGPTTVQPPMKVIRAIQSHRSNSPHQLSFEKGDFFHVLNDPKDGEWYEAHNPSTGARGLVPVHMFESFARGSSTYVRYTTLLLPSRAVLLVPVHLYLQIAQTLLQPPKLRHSMPSFSMTLLQSAGMNSTQRRGMLSP
jgi:hypothetical protein